jgi:hypothetical protein
VTTRDDAVYVSVVNRHSFYSDLLVYARASEEANIETVEGSPPFCITEGSFYSRQDKIKNLSVSICKTIQIFHCSNLVHWLQQKR